jgi:hypothetical protein
MNVGQKVQTPDGKDGEIASRRIPGKMYLVKFVTWKSDGSPEIKFRQYSEKELTALKEGAR